jgi:molybdopterin converting factor small subunit
MPSLKIPPGHFILLYFASAATYTSKDSEVIEAPLPLSGLFDHLEQKYRGIKQKVLESCLVTINLEYVDIPKDIECQENIVIEAGDEVAVIPPVSSG